MNIKTFAFNPFQLNTFVIYDESKSAIIVDAGNSNSNEDNLLFDFIEEKNLQIEGLYYTHAHVDHIVGNNAIINKYNIQSYAHIDSQIFFQQAESYAPSLGFNLSKLILPNYILNCGDEIIFGNSKLSIICTPGHADGSVCFYSAEFQLVIVGDVLFRDSIGRTDLPTGDFELLSKSIKEKLFKLPNEVKVFPGHGPNTSIGHEKLNNPFVKIG